MELFGVIERFEDELILVKPLRQINNLETALFDKNGLMVGQISGSFGDPNNLKYILQVSQDERIKRCRNSLGISSQLFYYSGEQKGKKEQLGVEKSELNLNQKKLLIRANRKTQKSMLKEVIEKIKDLKIDESSESGATDKNLPNIDQLSNKSPSISSLIMNSQHMKDKFVLLREIRRRQRYIEKKSKVMMLNKPNFQEEIDKLDELNDQEGEMQNELDIGKRKLDDANQSRWNRNSKERRDRSSGSSRLSLISDPSPNFLNIQYNEQGQGSESQNTPLQTFTANKDRFVKDSASPSFSLNKQQQDMDEEPFPCDKHVFALPPQSHGMQFSCNSPWISRNIFGKPSG